MQKCGKSSGIFHNVYLKTTATVAGPKEKKGPLGSYFDLTFTDPYCGMENWEKAEIILQKEAILKALQKGGLKIDDLDVVIGGDLNNQLAVTSYNLRAFDVSYLGIYAACVTCVEGLIIGSCLVAAGFAKNVLTIASSHNATSERQFRYPTEYGGQKPTSMTSTATGAGGAIISMDAALIKITKMTIGKVVDPALSDNQDMGRAMAPAAAMVLKQHFIDFNLTPNDYDLILTGDLSTYGSQVLKEIMKELGYPLGDNYHDAGLMLYDLKKQAVFAGGSGAGCISLVGLGYVIEAMKKGLYHKVLLVATGALMNPIMVAQNETIPGIAHAIALERKEYK